METMVVLTGTNALVERKILDTGVTNMIQRFPHFIKVVERRFDIDMRNTLYYPRLLDI